MITENFQIPLHKHQIDVIQDAFTKRKDEPLTNGIYISVPMGYGKTIIGLMLILADKNRKNKSLIVCSKTLVDSWQNEIHKFFHDNIEYEIFHPDYMKNIKEWIPDEKTQIILTTPEMISKSYVSGEVEKHFISRMPSQLNYNVVIKPFTSVKKGPEILHSMTFQNIVIDECQNYCNIYSTRCKALASLSADFRWGLSGTVLQEISMERIFGLFLLVNQLYPRNINDCNMFLSKRGRGSFLGFKSLCIYRDTLPQQIVMPKLMSKILYFKLDESEILCFSLIRELILMIWKQYKDPRNDNIHRKKLGGFILSMITYLRQSLITSELVFDKISMYENNELIDFNGIISKTLKANQKLIKKSSEISSRVKTCLNCLKSHKNDVIIIFGSFSSGLLYLQKIVNEQLPQFNTYFLSGEISGKKRQKLIAQYKKETSSAILFATYMLGSEGLNLQNANVAINLDLYWNNGKEAQALARIYRPGQKHKEIYQYILISNVSIENKILEKQATKLKAINEFMDGKVDSFYIPKISFEEMVDLVEEEKMVAVSFKIGKK